MDYEKAYKESLERATKLAFTGNISAKAAGEIFPELKESEDERIRKEIISFLKEGKPYYYPNSAKRQEWAAWLEKQGNLMGALQEANKKIGELVEENYYLKEQGEQKPTDNIEPKFKVGDWIIKDNYSAQQVKELREEAYILDGSISGVETLPKKYIENNYHLWTIQDAKDGDVLVAEIEEEPNDFIYIFKEYDKNFGFLSHCYLDAYINKFHKGIYHNNLNVGVPATKEQHVLLFQKMHEAGYTWNAEKKELKKIEHKPAWSEEDEKMVSGLVSIVEDWYNNQSEEEKEYYGNCGYVNFLKSIKARVQPQQKQEWSEKDEAMLLHIIEHFEWFYKEFHPNVPTFEINWLKSLKPQNHWKPTEEQMKHLKSISVGWHPSLDDCRILSSLYNDLKKL